MFDTMDIQSWDENIESIINEQKIKCSSNKWLHKKEMESLNEKNKILSISNVLIISLSATASTITNNFSSLTDSTLYILNIIYSIIFFFSAFLNSLQQILNYSKVIEQHRTAYLRYSELYNNIKRMLTLEVDHRDYVNDYFTWVNKEYDNIAFSAPEISTKVYKKFIKTFEFNPKTDIINELNIESNNKVEYLENENKEKDIENGKIEQEKFKYELDRFRVNCLNP